MLGLSRDTLSAADIFIYVGASLRPRTLSLSLSTRTAFFIHHPRRHTHARKKYGVAEKEKAERIGFCRWLVAESGGGTYTGCVTAVCWPAHGRERDGDRAQRAERSHLPER